MKRYLFQALGVTGLLAAAAVAGRQKTTLASAASVGDTVVPREVALERFRAGLARTGSLTGGAASRDALVQAFVRALEASDTVALRAMVMTRAEYAWLYYPTNPQGLPPYDLSPSLYWFMLDTRSQQGLGHALNERAGVPLHVAGYHCDPQPSIEGTNRVWGPCLLHRVQAPGDTVAERLFGPIIERGGRFKFVSYANKL